MIDDYVKVGQSRDFPPGTLKKVQVRGEDVLIANVGGKFYAIANTCTHRGGPLNEGELEESMVICPWHGGKFDLTNGKVVSPPPMRDEAAYDVELQGSDILLRKR